MDLNHLLGSLPVLKSPIEVNVHPLSILMKIFPGAHHVQLENIVSTDFNSIVLLELIVMVILVEHVVLDLSVLMVKAKWDVLVKPTH